ncbi:XdhC family protein [Pseudorhodobacter ferrugineus]|uniref:XdhC family protein n=1 Tax=Pseudorhodobacter ferrugineus TaxID=77008 RepID=UPI0003B5CC20|nr:XdhC family protein [Pseudorhodobacter ferrugineus]
MQTTYDDIPEIALAWHRQGKGAVLATVIETWGSAPRPVGSQLAIAGDGAMMGSVSGGCVESAVVHEALECLACGVPKLLTFGVADADAFAVGLACGGTIRVLVEPVGDAAGAFSPVLLKGLVTARAVRQPVVVLTHLETFERRLMSGPSDALSDVVADRMRSDRSGLEEDGWFVAVHNPPLRMVIVGAVHIAQALVHMARACGYDPILIDPRGAFGSQTRFPGETITEDWPDEAMAAIVPDARTAVVTLTHDSKLDDPALLSSLGTPAFYIGSLGSTRTHAKRVERLTASGLTADQIARIHAPVGLNIGAKSPAEIAVSIMAQITQTLRQR